MGMVQMQIQNILYWWQTMRVIWTSQRTYRCLLNVILLLVSLLTKRDKLILSSFCLAVQMIIVTSKVNQAGITIFGLAVDRALMNTPFLCGALPNPQGFRKKHSSKHQAKQFFQLFFCNISQRKTANVHCLRRTHCTKLQFLVCITLGEKLLLLVPCLLIQNL